MAFPDGALPPGDGVLALGDGVLVNGDHILVILGVFLTASSAEVVRAFRPVFFAPSLFLPPFGRPRVAQTSRHAIYGVSQTIARA